MIHETETILPNTIPVLPSIMIETQMCVDENKIYNVLI